MNLKKLERVFTSKFVGTGPSSYKKRIYRFAVSQRLRNTALDQSMKARRGSSGASLTSALDAGWVANYSPRTLYPRYPLYMMLGRPQGPFGRERISRLHLDSIPGSSRP